MLFGGVLAAFGQASCSVAYCFKFINILLQISVQKKAYHEINKIILQRMSTLLLPPITMYTHTGCWWWCHIRLHQNFTSNSPSSNLISHHHPANPLIPAPSNQHLHLVKPRQNDRSTLPPVQNQPWHPLPSQPPNMPVSLIPLTPLIFICLTNTPDPATSTISKPNPASVSPPSSKTHAPPAASKDAAISPVCRSAHPPLCWRRSSTQLLSDMLLKRPYLALSL